ncbi:MAG: 3'-5' exonuclease, partial [Spirochaetota bacterium]
VGDDDQSIYRFRGAEVRNILGFPEEFPDTEIVRLERNYRSYQSILDLASKVVENNEGRMGKVLRAERKGGEKPVLAVLRDQDEEAAYCIRIIDKHVRAGGLFSDVAILYRTNAQSRPFEGAFPGNGIPYRLVGALRFYEREEVKDALALLALASNPRDEVAFRRVVNKPPRGIGKASMEAVIESAFHSDPDSETATMDDLVATAATAKTRSAKAKAGLLAFSCLIKELDSLLMAGEGSANPPQLSTIVEAGIKSSGLLDYHRSQDDIAGTQKVANLDELVNAASDYPATREGLSAFLEAVELDRAMSSGDVHADAVTLITMHNTKGLEFPVVVITGMEQGLFPRDDDEDEDLEEQRRLFYVALTRAKDELHLTYCRSRLFRGRIMDYPPSCFLGEIPATMFRSFGGTVDLGASSEVAKWKTSTPVYHDDYGSGYIIKAAPAGEAGVCVTVRFETGRTMQFFPKFTKKLERISY